MHGNERARDGALVHRVVNAPHLLCVVRAWGLGGHHAYILGGDIRDTNRGRGWSVIVVNRTVRRGQSGVSQNLLAVQGSVANKISALNNIGPLIYR